MSDPRNIVTPSAASAQFLSYAGQPIRDPAVFNDGGNVDRVDGKYCLVPPQSEILNLIQLVGTGAVALKGKNSSGSGFTAGQLVYVSGHDGTQAILSLSDITQSTGTDSKPPQYVVSSPIANGAVGIVYAYATVTGQNTSTASSVGSYVYADSTAGGWTLTQLTWGFRQKIVGIVTVKDASGSIFFFPGIDWDFSRQPYFLPVHNSTGLTIAAGPVALDKWVETNLAFNIVTAQTSIPATHILGTALADGQTGVVQLVRTVTGALDTSLAAVGDPVYLNPSTGGVTLSAVAAEPLVQVVGYVKTIANPGDYKGFIVPPKFRQIPRVRVYQSGTINVAGTGVNVELSYDQERWDTDNMHSVVSQTKKLVCNTAGLYHLEGCVSITANATGMRSLCIILNSTTTIASVRQVNSSASYATDLVVSTDWYLNAGDYVVLNVAQDSGINLNMIASPDAATEFSATFIGK